MCGYRCDDKNEESVAVVINAYCLGGRHPWWISLSGCSILGHNGSKARKVVEESPAVNCEWTLEI